SLRSDSIGTEALEKRWGAASRDASPRDSSERTHKGAEPDDDGERYKGADDSDHHDISIALPVRRSADRQQSDHRAIVRQAIECARTDHRDTMEQLGIEPYPCCARHLGRSERVE